jgi:hypothetical protein
LQYRALHSNSSGFVQANNSESFRCAGLDDSR